MCGIMGVSRLTNNTRKMLPFMAIAMEMRGSDSWGASDGQELIKRVGPISSSFEIPEHWTQAIIHTRAATVGAVSERNAHPFEVVADNGRRIVGIHNGHVSNYEFMKTKHSRPLCEVDSEHIFWHLAEGKPMNDLSGRGTIAWFDGSDVGDGRQAIHLARWNYGDLEVARLASGEIVFASTRRAIEQAARISKVKIEDNGFYALLIDGVEHSISLHEDGRRDEIYKLEKLGFESYAPQQPTWGYNYRHYTAGSDWKPKNTCYKCREECKEYICKKCVIEYKKDYQAELGRRSRVEVTI